MKLTMRLSTGDSRLSRIDTFVQCGGTSQWHFPAGWSWAEFGGSSWPFKKNPTKNHPSGPVKSAAPAKFAAPPRNSRGGWDKFVGLRGGQPGPFRKLKFLDQAGIASQLDNTPQKPSKSSSSKPGPTKSSSSDAGPSQSKSSSSGLPRFNLDDNARICSKCVAARQYGHKCKICGYIRCKQFHMEARDDGRYFVCQACDPDVVGLENIEKPDGIIPDLPDEHDARQNVPPAGPSNRSDSPDSNTVPPTPKRSKVVVPPTTPTHIRMSVPPTTPTHLRPSVIVRTPDKSPATPVLEVPGSDCGPSVQCFQSNPQVPDMLFLGPPGNYVWDKKSLRNYFFVIPSMEVKVITLRAAKDCTMLELWPNILNYYYDAYKVQMLVPTFWFRGRKVDRDDTLFSYPTWSLFLISPDDNLAPEPKSHEGKVRQCKSCNKAWRDSTNKPKGCAHVELWFGELLGKTTGNNLDRPNQPKPRGCPVGHYGEGEDIRVVPDIVVAGPSQPRAAPRPSTPARAKPNPQYKPSTPRAARKSTAPPECPQTRAVRPSPSPKLVRTAKSAAVKRLAVEASSDSDDVEDISGASESGSEYAPKSDEESADEESADDNNNLDAPSSDDDREGVEEQYDSEDDDREGQSDFESSDDEREAPADLTDTEDEEDDSEEDRHERRLRKDLILNKIADKLAAPTFRKNVYVADEEDQDYITRYVVAPIMKKSHLVTTYGSTAPAEVMQMIVAGQRPNRNTEGVNTSLFSTTSVLYTRGLMELLGLYQEKMIDDGNQERLVQGRLKVAQFFHVKKFDFLYLPEDITSYLDKMTSGNKKLNALSGFKELVEGLQLWSTEPEAQKMFMERYEHQRDMTEHQMRIESDNERTRFRQRLREVKENLAAGKKYSQYTGQKNLETRERAAFRQDYEGETLPDPKVAVTAYLNSEESRAILRELEKLAINKTVVGWKKMSRITRKFIKRLLPKLGVRQQVLGDPFTRKLFLRAVNKGAASFPYVQAGGQQRSQIYRDVVPSGQGIYVRNNPHAPDPQDPNDPRSREDWDLQHGIAVLVLHHKTGAKYPMWLWFSQVDTTYLHMYEEVTHNFCKANNINWDAANNQRKLNSPFFIDGKGKASISSRCQPLDFFDFAAIAGIPSATSYIFRKMFAGLLMSQENMNLRETEEYALGHAPTTAKTFYQAELVKKAKACQAFSWYETLLSKDTPAAQASSQVFSDREQAVRHQAGILALSREQLADRIAREDKRDRDVPLTKNRVTNNITRCALIDLIIRCGTWSMDQLMTGKPLLNKKSNKVIMRMLTLIPHTGTGADPDMKTLIDNMLYFAELSEEDMLTPKQVLKTYAQKLIRQLHQLRLVPKLESTKLKVLLGDVVKEHGYKYLFGNPALEHQIKLWVRSEQAMEEQTAVPERVQTVDNWVTARGEAVPSLSTSTGPPIPQPTAGPGPSTSTGPPVPQPTAGPSTPAYSGEKKITWTPKMKVQLVDLFMTKAINPLERPGPNDGLRSRAVYRKNVPRDGDLYARSSIYLDSGEKVTLRSAAISIDRIHDHLASGKISKKQKSPGLVSIIDEVMGDLPRTMGVLKSKRKEIMELANSLLESDE